MNMPKRASRHHAMRASRAAGLSACGAASADMPPTQPTIAAMITTPVRTARRMRFSRSLLFDDRVVRRHVEQLVGDGLRRDSRDLVPELHRAHLFEHIGCQA